MNKTKNIKTLQAVYFVVLALFLSVLVCNQTLNTYKVLFKQRYIDYLEALSHAQEVLIRALKDQSLLFDESWKTEMGQSLETLNLKSDELAKLNPRYINLHAITVNLADETHLYSETLMKSINGLDINNTTIDFSVSMIHMGNIGKIMQEIDFGLGIKNINNSP